MIKSVIGKLGVILIGAGIIFMWYKEKEISGHSKKEPTAITALQCEKEGPGDNAYVILTDFKLSKEAYVYMYREHRLTSDSWECIYIPATTSENHGSKLDPSKIRLLIVSKNVKGKEEMESFASRTTLEGIVSKGMIASTDDTKELLRKSYPGIDLDNLYCLSEGDKPASNIKLIAMLGGGIACCLYGLYSLMKGQN